MADEIRRTDRVTGLQSWSDDERWWRENYRTRPYVDENLGFEHYEPAYRYGYESAERLDRRPWNEVEPDLRRGWDRYEGRGDSKWEDVKDSVRDAWDRLTAKVK